MKTMRLVAIAVVAGVLAGSPALANFHGGFWHGSHSGPGSSTSSGSGGPTPVPEPADVALFGLGVAGVALGRRFRSRKTKG